jgi:hypothetical protein
MARKTFAQHIASQLTRTQPLLAAFAEHAGRNRMRDVYPICLNQPRFKNKTIILIGSAASPGPRDTAAHTCRS